MKDCRDVSENNVSFDWWPTTPSYAFVFAILGYEGESGSRREELSH